MANSTDKSILTAAGKALLAQLNAEEKALVIDKMIFANVPNRPEYPQPDDVVPTDHIVHQEQVEQRGRLSADSVIYSTTLTSDVGPFDFNWTGAYCSEYGVLVTIDHHALTPKTADEPGVAGNTLVRSVVLEYKDIAEITNITVDASSWQYNATERMKKMDSDVAQSIIDQNGKDWFIEDGFLVTPSGSAYSIKAGAGYVSGNRVAMEFDRSVQVPNKPSFIYIDAHREGTPTGEQVTLFNFVVTEEEKDDYIDSSTGKDVKHFVCKIAQVHADGSVSDLRPEGLNKQWSNDSFVMAKVDTADDILLLATSPQQIITKRRSDKFNFVASETGSAKYVLSGKGTPGSTDGGSYFVNAKGDKYQLDYGKTLKSSYFDLDPSTESNNTDKALAFFAACQHGDTLDFCGHEYRVFEEVAGIESTNDGGVAYAVPVERVPTLFQKIFVKIKNGGLYAANQSVSDKKMRYPSTAYFKQCVDLEFDNALFESKGESWGDSDASAPLGPDARMDFCAANGGHALFFARCSGVKGKFVTRFCGSVAPAYFASCEKSKLKGAFSNAVSLGYAPFCFDSWCGGKNVTGFEMHDAELINCGSHKEKRLRREDGAVTGSSKYAGKGAIVAEDPDVYVIDRDGRWFDQYPNGSSKDIGAVYNATSAKIDAYNPIFDEVAFLGRVGNSSGHPGILNVYNPQGKARISAIVIGNTSYSSVHAVVKGGDVEITRQSLWPDDGETAKELTVSSIVANRKVTSYAYVHIESNIHGDIDFGFINTRACYGSITFGTGIYDVKALCDSVGWGGGSIGSRLGVLAVGKPEFRSNREASELFVKYTNRDPQNVYTYVNIDLDGALINRPGIAAFDELNLHNSPSLKEKVIFPKLLQGYYAQTVHRPIEQMEAIVNGIVGISGSSTVVELFMTANRLPRQSHSILLSNGEIKKCEGIDPGAGPDSGMLSVHCYYPGDIRNLFTNGEKLTLLSA
ncbi:phage tail-collar fiber domain-containing protein [Vibrio parahaemolyticus]|uniref:phage tail-collar fiber domain-containing protein n=1 Tax=Vibrio parahaemolyticus TaxID=670 RepID=UPI001F34B8F0|nr:phage tail protein [Vibrio parahaemolyticus]